MVDDLQKILYRGVELRTPIGFDAFFKAYAASHGIETFCKRVKGHLEACRTIHSIFQDRAEAEEVYAQKLRKISIKMTSATKNEQGTVAASLKAVATSMAEEAQQHIEFHGIFADRIGSSLKNVLKSYETTLKNVEKQYEKSEKKLKEKRSSLKSLKKKCFQKMQDGKKDTLKGDGEFYNKSLRLESIRAEFEILVIKTIAILHSVEKLRLTELHGSCVAYYNHLANWIVRINSQAHELEPVISTANVNSDLLQLAEEPPGTNHKFIEQPLPDFAAEEMEINIDKSVRLQLITQYLAWARKCLENESKSKFDLLKALQGLNIHDPQEAETIETTRNQLIMASATQDYLEACEWKFTTLIAAITGNPQPSYRLSHCVIRNHDSNNNPVSILRVPLTTLLQVLTCQMGSSTGQIQHPVSPVSLTSRSNQPGVAAPSGYMRVIADYVARRDVEMDLKKGDLAFVILAWDPFWWLVCNEDRIGEVPSHCFGE